MLTHNNAYFSYKKNTESKCQTLKVHWLNQWFTDLKLMPRIKNWKDLNFYKPSPEYVYKEIESLFTKESIDWDY